jgi:hypothetical protein
VEVDAATAWPFATGGAVSERMEWLTDAMSPPYGPPQNRKLRQAPRTYFQFDGLESQDNRRWMETLLNNNGAGLWHAPVVTDKVELTAAITGGATSIAVATSGRRFIEGGNAMLLGANPRDYQVLEIDTVAADSITLVDPVTDSWPVGSILVPTVGAHLAQTPVLPRFTGDDVPYSISFRADEPLDWTADVGDATYRSYPVFELPIEWSNDPSYAPERNVALVDNEIGPVRVYDQAGMVLPVFGFSMTLVGRTAISDYRAFLWALSGRWSPLWVPTLAQDVRLLSVHSTTALNVVWSGLADWELRGNRRDIRIQRAGFAPIYRRITSVSSVDANTERMVLDSALPGGFDADDVTCISFMALCCQDTDINALRLWSFDVVQSELMFRGINNDF